MAETIQVSLFESGHLGAGDSRKIRDFRYHRVHGSVDMRWPGQMRLGLALQVVNTVNHDLTPVFAAEWIIPGNSPAVYYLVGRQIRRLQGGTAGEVGTNALGSTNVTGGMLDDDGSGVPYLYACFGGTSSDNPIRRMDSSENVTTGDLVADLFLSLNGKAYRSVAPSSENINSQVSVIPYGSDRFVAANWGTPQTVGFAGTNINRLAAIRQAPVAIKPEGIFAYSEELDRWINFTPAWEAFPHPDNGRGSFSLGDRLVVTMGDGGAVIFDGRSAIPFDPMSLNSTPNLHTTRGDLETVGTLHHWLVGITPSASKLIKAGTDLDLYTEISSNVTTGSDAVSDANDGSNIAIDGVGVSPDAIWVGAPYPFTAVYYEGVDNTTSRTLTLAVGQSDGSYVTVTHRDFSTLAGAPLGQTGSLILTEDPVAVRNWEQTTVASVTQYWLRIQTDGAFSSGTTWVHCFIQPWYPSVDDTNFPLDGLDRSGCFPHVLFALMPEDEPIWHDAVSLPQPDSIGAVIFANIGGDLLNHPRNLYLIGRYKIWRLQVSPGDLPDTQGHPFLHNVGLVEGAAGVPVPEKLCRLVSVKINGQQFDPAVLGRFYYTWDYGKPWTRAGPTVAHVPASMRIDNSGKGYLFRWAFGWQQPAETSRLTQPVVTSIVAEFEPLDDPLDSIQERALQNDPPRF